MSSSSSSYPLIVVKVPHQMPATAWVAWREEDLWSASVAALPDGCEMPATPTLEDFREAIGNDLHACILLCSADAVREYRDALKANRNGAHQWGRILQVTSDAADSIGWRVTGRVVRDDAQACAACGATCEDDDEFCASCGAHETEG